jgi:hypothetical protein
VQDAFHAATNTAVANITDESELRADAMAAAKDLGVNAHDLPATAPAKIDPRDCVTVVYPSAGSLYMDFHPAEVGASGTFTDGVGAFVVQHRKKADGGISEAEAGGVIPGDLLHQANGHTGLERRPFSEVCSLLQELPRPLSLVFVHRGLKLTMQRTSGMVDSEGLQNVIYQQTNKDRVFFENQRWNLPGWGSSFPGHLLPNDRGKWSDRSGKVWTNNLDTTGLVIDLTLPGCDPEGWEYAFDFKYFQSDTNDPAKRKKFSNSYVRRRHWVPREDLARAIEAASAAGTEFNWGVTHHNSTKGGAGSDQVSKHAAIL